MARPRWVTALLVGAVGSTIAVVARAEAAPAADAPPPAAAEEPQGAPDDAAKPMQGATEAPAPSPPPRTKPSIDTRAAATRAYQAALARRKLGPIEKLSQQRIVDELAAIEERAAAGRTDEAIGDLVYLVEAPRFDPFLKVSEGRAAVFLLGDLLGRAGAVEPAAGYLLRLLDAEPSDPWYRRAVRSLVDFGLESDRPEVFVEHLRRVPDDAPEELRGDVDYLRGRAHQRAGQRAEALAVLARVTPRSRFWAQATYLAGLLEVERGKLRKGEQLFCKVADAKQTPKAALLFGGAEFFRVRDLSRLALGRVAHEQYRFDDARYYYYLVPSDSEVLPEALYESATGRYEAKDYPAARDLVNELRNLDVHHAYEDELWVFEAYLDMAECEFPKADAKLKRFLETYEPIRDSARKLVSDERARRALVDVVRVGADPATAGLGVEASVARTLAALVRVDDDYARVARRLARLDHQMSGLRRTMAELDDVKRRLASSKDVQPRAASPVTGSVTDRIARAQAQVAEVRRLLREAERAGSPDDPRLEPLRSELAALEVRVRALRAGGEPSAQAPGTGEGLEDHVAKDRRAASELHARAERARQKLLGQQSQRARAALERLDRRLSRLLRRARLGRIETVLGKKRALEVEIEALSQGLLPRGAVDSLDAARYLRDDEEYWPYDGEDWADEYVGGEGLR
jgi:hypothetical protein